MPYLIYVLLGISITYLLFYIYFEETSMIDSDFIAY